MNTQGDENALGFSLRFDPSVLTYLDAVAQPHAPEAVLNLNTNQAALGRIGVALACPPNRSLAAGYLPLVQIFFRAANNPLKSSRLEFADDPIPREISDVLALPTTGRQQYFRTKQIP